MRSILVMDDEPDVAELFRQRFRRETRQGTYVLHYAASGEEALDRLSSDGPLDNRSGLAHTNAHRQVSRERLRPPSRNSDTRSSM